MRRGGSKPSPGWARVAEECAVLDAREESISEAERLRSHVLSLFMCLCARAGAVGPWLESCWASCGRLVRES